MVIYESKEIILEAKEYIEKWLEKIGLKLNPDKTRVVHTLQSTDGSEPGFNFLGFSIRQDLTKTHEKGYKTHTKPNLENQKRHKRKIRSNDYLYAREGDKSPKLYYQGMDQLFPNRGV